LRVIDCEDSNEMIHGSETVDAILATCSSSSGSLSGSSSASFLASASSAIIPSFTGQSGSMHNLYDKTLCEFFSILVPDELLDVVVKQTSHPYLPGIDSH